MKESRFPNRDEFFVGVIYADGRPLYGVLAGSPFGAFIIGALLFSLGLLAGVLA